MVIQDLGSIVNGREIKSNRQPDYLSSRRIMLFDLSTHGHHPAYIQHLINYWHTQKLSGHLDIVVSPNFLQHHADVVNLIPQAGIETVSFVAIAPELDAELKPRKSGWNRTQRAFQEWNILCKYARQLNADHCLIMYFDTCQLPLAFGRTAPCRVSGIYFRPTFHYSQFSQTTPSWKTRLQAWRERFLLARVLQKPSLSTLFSLDPFAVQFIDQLHSSRKAIALPDPVETTHVSDAQVKHLRQQLGIETGRQVFLLFGALTARKGIYQLLDAISMLPADLSQKLCLVLAGQANSQEQDRMTSQIAALKRISPAQVITHYEFISESEVQSYFHLADVVLAPYQQHVGMSGILIWAAVAQKPVLSSNYGLMGELVKRYHLGLSVDSTVPVEIAGGLIQFLENSSTVIGDIHQMRLFAEQNSAEQFANKIFSALQHCS